MYASAGPHDDSHFVGSSRRDLFIRAYCYVHNLALLKSVL